MTGWWIGLLVALALLAGAGALAWTQAWLMGYTRRPDTRRPGGRHGGHDSGSGHAAGSARPEPAPEQHHELPGPDEPWYQEIRPEDPEDLARCAYCDRQIAQLGNGSWADGDGLLVCHKRRGDQPYQLHQPVASAAPWQPAPLPDTTLDGQPRVPGYLA